jgi:polysaccharide export outer membrane protein
MRVSQFMLPVVLGLAVCGCMRHQPQAYYVVDPATGQPVPVVQHYGQAPYAQPQHAPQYHASGYRQPAAQPQYAPYGQVYGQVYQQPSPLPQPQAQVAQGERRGLFHSRRRARQQPYAVQPYAVQPYGQQPYVQQYRAPHAAAPSPYAYAPSQQPYTLDAGDKLRVNVFGQQGISGAYMVDAGGNVSLPLIGAVPARGFTPDQLSRMIAERLKQGYVRDPSVTVAVEAYRPFFILGEVTTPGQYPYVPNMTAESAVAIAGGFSARAQKRTIELTRNAGGQHFKGEVPLTTPLRPGDTIVVKERWF